MCEFGGDMYTFDMPHSQSLATKYL